MSNNPEQELCITTVDSPEPIAVCCSEKEDPAQEKLALSPEATTDQAPNANTQDPAPELATPEQIIANSVVASKPSSYVSASKCKVQAPPQPQKSRLPRAIYLYYLQFGFTPQAVDAILHLPPQDLTNKKVSFVPTTPPKNC